MKRIIAILCIAVMWVGSLSAQNYMIVNSEELFKSLNDYTSAIKTLDTESDNYQKQVDERYATVEKLYNNYMVQRASLSAESRQITENKILAEEKEAAGFQESIFGTDGTIMKRRLELIQPIQQFVFAALEEYAKANGYDMVIDSASNATILYNSAAVDHTARVIEFLKTFKTN